MEVLIQVTQLFLSLSFLVILHELGHFIPAKVFGCRVNSFYLFFNPKFSLFKKKIGETEYGIGWLPLGGYVKIAGMVDESMDTESLSKDPEPWEFRSKPAWQRLIIMLGGVIVNVILAILIFGFTTYIWGTNKLPIEEISEHGLSVSEPAYQVGFRNGDVPHKVGGENVKYYRDFVTDIMLKKPSNVTVIRNGEEIVVPIDKRFIKAMVVTRKTGLFRPRAKFVVDSLVEDGAAYTGGLLVDDHLIAINNVKFTYYDEIVKFVDTLKGKEIDVTVLRYGIPVVKTIKLSSEGRFGIYPRVDFDYEHIDYNSLSKAFTVGNTNSYNLLKLQIKSLAWIFDPEIEGYKGVGSFISMAGMYSTTWDWASFWGMTAMLSLMLAFMNVLPIPALDGGHAMFLMYEIIFRRKPSQKFLEKAQMFGMVILLSFMIFAIGNDLFN